MSHIHIPDGVLPLWLVAAGWVLAAALVLVAAHASRHEDIRRRVPLLGVVSALVLVSMSSEIVPIAYHINLSVVAGALLGPWLAIISAFIIEVVLAMIGHGGVTVAGLNTLMIAGEMVFGWLLFRGFTRLLSRKRVRVAAFASTVLTLAVTTTLLVGIVALAGSGAATARETGALDPASLRFENPFGEGVFSVNTLRGEDDADEEAERETALSVRRFAAIVYTLGPIGWLVEALVTAGVLGYVARLRPNLVFFGALAGERRHPLWGDEHGGR